MKYKKGLTLLSAGVMAAVLSLGVTGCNEKTQPQATDIVAEKTTQVTKLEGKTFGTFYYITVPGGYPGGKETLQKDAEFVFKKVSDAISTFDKNAEIARFNDFKSTEDFVISGYLANIIEEVSRQSLRVDQAMDPTVGPLVNLWGFGPSGDIKKSPTDELIAQTKSYVGLDKFELRRAGNTAYLRKADPRVALDLSTIGEGLAADELAALMDEKNIPSYMIAVAGAIRSKGGNADGKLWRVGVEDPLSQGAKVFQVVCPQGMAISTAGSYRNFFLDEDTNKFYSHVIDTKTGRPIDHRTVSVTVIDKSAMVTDALDTGLLVLGAQEAVQWGNKNSTPVYAIEIDDEGKQVATYSRAFEPYLKCVVNQNIATAAPPAQGSN
ncbi:FAD:protein FMN transferase [Anaerobiospirillum sp. NML120448]|uniref:FAD:protein FMN transferase n=1 Tax=Anaerobiospirillum sp. NML120448 TaxID=2932816 RepID=UPI001FF3FA59|nr:FAD:protein FMN transferase [Anaerobiospirillum sp. NML120448]MCK0513422.1 FAD:protein FMN transferase [Anaerobiospirillum sp. NML120448]